MQKSLVVQGKSLEEALEKAAVLLHCPKERVAYEVLQEARPGKYGQPGTPCKLRGVPVAEAPEAADANAPEEQDYASSLPWSPDVMESLSPAVFLHALEGCAAVSSPPPAAAPEPEADAPCRDVVGDVNLSTGDIRHNGDVRIFGSVRKGMRVTAAGSLFVQGDVETAALEVGGDITLYGGLLGTARSTRGSITCKFAQGARLTAPEGDITVHDAAMHSHLHAGRAVYVGDTVLGGSCYGEELVEVHVAGSESGVPALLIAGRNKRLLDEIEEIRQRATTLVPTLGECEQARRELLPTEEGGQPLPVADRIRLWRATAQRAHINAELFGLARQKKTLLGMINGERGARVCITGRAYPRVKILVDEAPLDLKNVTQYATFSKDYDTGELRMTSYS